MKKVGRPPLVSDKILTEIKSILSSLRISGATITRKVVRAVGNGALSACSPEKMAENVGSITLSTK